MKQVLILLVFGLPASLVLLAVGGDLMLSGEPEPPRMAAEEEEPPPEPIDAGDSPIRQKILNWKYRHFDPELGVFDWVALGTEATPRDAERYDVVKPRVLFSSYTKTTPLLKKTLTRLEAGSGWIKFGKEHVLAELGGRVELANTELFTEEGLSEVSLRTENLNVKAANRRGTSDVAAAEFWTDSLVHVTGPSFEVFGRGGMRGATELNMMRLEAPVTMHLIAQSSGVFFGREEEGREGGRHVDVESKGPLLVKRVPEENTFLMSLSGGVVVTDGDVSVSSDKLGVKLGKTRTIEKAAAIGDIVVRQGGEERISCEEAKWDVTGGRTVLTGERGVRFVDGKNILVAKAATLMEDRKTLELGGEVQAHLYGSIGTEKKPGDGEIPSDWWVYCGRAVVVLADQGGSLSARSVLLLPARGRRVLVTSTDGSYEITGGSVAWDAVEETVEIRQKPQLRRGKSEWVNSELVRVKLKEGEVRFSGSVEASFPAGGASWKFSAGEMSARFRLVEDERPEMDSIAASNPGGRVRVDYRSGRGAEIQLFSDRVTWDAAGQTAVLDSMEEKSAQRLQHGKDWVESGRIVFEPEKKKALFENSVRAHLEEIAHKKAAGAGGSQVVEAPFEMSSDRLTVLFDEQYETREARAQEGVKFEGSAGGVVLECEQARYVRGGEITFEGKERPEFASGKNRLSAEKILVNLLQGRITFTEKVRGEFDDGKGALMSASCGKMIALYETKSGDLKEVYFVDSVHVESKEEQGGSITADAERAVYEVSKGQLSLTGSPVVVNQPVVVIRDEKIVYDMKEKKWFTKPGTKGYNWEIDPSGWKKE